MDILRHRDQVSALCIVFLLHIDDNCDGNLTIIRSYDLNLDEIHVERTTANEIGRNRIQLVRSMHIPILRQTWT